MASGEVKTVKLRFKQMVRKIIQAQIFDLERLKNILATLVKNDLFLKLEASCSFSKSFCHNFILLAVTRIGALQHTNFPVACV